MISQSLLAVCSARQSRQGRAQMLAALLDGLANDAAADGPA